MFLSISSNGKNGIDHPYYDINKEYYDNLKIDKIEWVLFNNKTKECIQKSYSKRLKEILNIFVLDLEFIDKIIVFNSNLEINILLNELKSNNMKDIITKLNNMDICSIMTMAYRKFGSKFYNHVYKPYWSISDIYNRLYNENIYIDQNMDNIRFIYEELSRFE